LQGYASRDDSRTLDDLTRLYTAPKYHEDLGLQARPSLKLMHDGSPRMLAAIAMERYPLSLDDDPSSALGRACGDIGAGIDDFFSSLSNWGRGGDSDSTGGPETESWASLHREIKDVTKQLDGKRREHDRAKNPADQIDLADQAHILEGRLARAVDAMAGRVAAAAVNGERGQDMGGPFSAGFTRLGDLFSNTRRAVSGK
jgi:hypothetical protein